MKENTHVMEVHVHLFWLTWVMLMTQRPTSPVNRCSYLSNWPVLQLCFYVSYFSSNGCTYTVHVSTWTNLGSLNYYFSFTSHYYIIQKSLHMYCPQNTLNFSNTWVRLMSVTELRVNSEQVTSCKHKVWGKFKFQSLCNFSNDFFFTIILYLRVQLTYSMEHSFDCDKIFKLSHTYCNLL